MFMTHTLRWFARRGGWGGVSAVSLCAWPFVGVDGESTLEGRGVGDSGVMRRPPRNRTVARAKLVKPPVLLAALPGAGEEGSKGVSDTEEEDTATEPWPWPLVAAERVRLWLLVASLP
jgi:hypothetical protein